MAAPLLGLRDITVRHASKTTLEVSALEIYPGEVVAVIGPNGAGKSTLLRVMGLLQRPSSGNIFFRGEEATPAKVLAMRRRMASVFQEPLLLNASVYDNAALGLKLRGWPREQIAKQLRPWFERLGIAALALRQVRTLSGGEAQRTSLARALALDPELLLLDEPFSALDAPTREALLVDLHEILRETGITAVIVTHDLHEAGTLGQRIGVLSYGKLLQLSSSEEVLLHPASAEVAAIVGVNNRIPGVVEAIADGMSTVRFNGGALQVSGQFERGSQVLLCVRPEAINIAHFRDEVNRSPATNRLNVKIIRVSPWMAQYRIVLSAGETCLVALISKSRFRELGLREGKEVLASFTAGAIHVIAASRS